MPGGTPGKGVVGQFGKNDAENPAETAGLYANWPTTGKGVVIIVSA
jgi:hypothetical protein